MNISRLRTEYLENPLGIGDLHPHLSWQLNTDRAGARQVAYRLKFASSQAFSDGSVLYDSDWVASDETTFIRYAGPELKSRQRVYWCVEVEDETGAKTISEVANFEIGLLEKSDWSAKWIETAITGGRHICAPVPMLRRRFDTDKKIVKARLYSTALGIYECYINGERVGDDHFAPGWTDYKQRIQYQTYDVTALLQNANEWTVLLGDGWYCGSVEWRGRQRYGTKPRFLGQIEVTFEDGTVETIITDESWQWATGPILQSDALMGESYDARLSYEDWNSVKIYDAPELEICAPISPPVRIVEEIVPVATQTLPHWPRSNFVVDFGQNLVGNIRIKLRGKKDQTIRFRYAEVLEGGPAASTGPIYTANLRSAAQTDYYTCKGDEEEVFQPKFTFHGFRYLEITGLGSIEDIVELVALVMHSDNVKSGDFECSEELVNQLQRNIDWGWRGNSFDLPTDCPQRDERLGWTGDAQVFVRTSAFIRDVAAFWREWARDVKDAQSSNGAIPCVVPDTGILGGDAAESTHSGASSDGGPAWADAVLICPWTIYRVYGDKRLLEENYEVFEKFLEYQASTARDYIRCYDGCDYYKGFGDWLALDGSGKTEGGTHNDLLGTAFFAHDADLMSRIAGVLGKTEDQQKYRELFEQIKAAFINRYVTGAGLLSPSFQTPYLLALEFNLLPDELRPLSAKELVREIGRMGGKLSTGFVGSPYINHVLTRENHLDTAYALLHQEQWPSYLYAVTQGATTIWERWDGWTHDKGFQNIGMNSFNHYAYGAIGAWLYQVVAGIELDDEIAGYKRFKLAPKPGGKLTYAKAYLDTLHGRIESSWTLENGVFKYRFVVPANTSAKVELPNGDSFDVVAGVHEGEVSL
jgi:alpha-L-rhamnosidase